MRKLPWFLLITTALLLLVMAATVGTLTVSSAIRTLMATRETMVTDTSTEVRQTGIDNGLGNRTQTGATCPGIEADNGFPQLQNTLIAGNWVRTEIIQEVIGSSWPAGRIYKVEMFADGVLKTTRYFQNATAAGAIEGVEFRVDLGMTGTTLPNSYTTLVTLLSSCS